MSFTSVVGRALTRRSMQQRWGEIDDMSGRKSLNSGSGGRAAVEYNFSNMSDVKLSCRRRPSLASDRPASMLPEPSVTHHGLARADSWDPESLDLLDPTTGSVRPRQTRRKRGTDTAPEAHNKYMTVANVPGELYGVSYEQNIPVMRVEEKPKLPAKAKAKCPAPGKSYTSMQDMEVKVSCECCGMSEEYTLGYVERVKDDFSGHWICGLCAEAVRMELHRLGGSGATSIASAVAAHMEPCRAARAPPSSDVAVPHAVCRLLRRHLSTPTPRFRRSQSSLGQSYFSHL